MAIPKLSIKSIMKTLITFLVTAVIAITFLHGCGPSEEELREQELARQQAERDSLERVYEAQMEPMIQDSIAQAERDSIAQAEQGSQIEFSEAGNYAVQVQSWRSREKAEQELREWQSEGYDNAYVVQYGSENTGNVWYRVRIGRVDTEEMAKSLQDELLQEHNTQSWISRVE